MCDFFKNSNQIKTNETNETNETNDNYSEFKEYENILISEISENEISEDEISEDDFANKSKQNLPFTKILKIMKNVKFETEYRKWFYKNEEDVRNAYYMIQTKYLNDININNITLEEFSIFCFLSN
jgi:hypothetical protein